jgi:hypothetical protein
MNRRDREFLDRQMRRLQPSSHPVGAMMLIVAVAFFVGMIAGSIIFPSQQPAQTASLDAICREEDNGFGNLVGCGWTPRWCLSG